ncbi:hypothetical protein [Stenotrophomonas sp. TWI587]|uniref:hypothetical protein n=1 Tax=Stenotrophomonas sp. TWI587 TaxID=3136783 RepID=UPI00320A5E2C
MSDIEKRALVQQLEKNAVVYELLGENELPRLLRKAAAALTPPDGYVLVPVEPTEAMLQEIHLVKSFTSEAMHRRYAAMIAARPEVLVG